MKSYALLLASNLLFSALGYAGYQDNEKLNTETPPIIDDDFINSIKHVTKINDNTRLLSLVPMLTYLKLERSPIDANTAPEISDSFRYTVTRLYSAPPEVHLGNTDRYPLDYLDKMLTIRAEDGGYVSSDELKAGTGFLLSGKPIDQGSKNVEYYTVHYVTLPVVSKDGKKFLISIADKYVKNHDPGYADIGVASMIFSFYGISK